MNPRISIPLDRGFGDLRDEPVVPDGFGADFHRDTQLRWARP
jgi:hypothetical protein